MSCSVCGQCLVILFPPFQKIYGPHTLLHINFISRSKVACSIQAI